MLEQLWKHSLQDTCMAERYNFLQIVRPTGLASTVTYRKMVAIVYGTADKTQKVAGIILLYSLKTWHELQWQAPLN